MCIRSTHLVRHLWPRRTARGSVTHPSHDASSVHRLGHICRIPHNELRATYLRSIASIPLAKSMAPAEGYVIDSCDACIHAAFYPTCSHNLASRMAQRPNDSEGMPTPPAKHAVACSATTNLSHGTRRPTKKANNLPATLVGNAAAVPEAAHTHTQSTYAPTRLPPCGGSFQRSVGRLLGSRGRRHERSKPRETTRPAWRRQAQPPEPSRGYAFPSN